MKTTKIAGAVPREGTFAIEPIKVLIRGAGYADEQEDGIVINVPAVVLPDVVRDLIREAASRAGVMYTLSDLDTYDLECKLLKTIAEVGLVTWFRANAEITI